MARVDENGVEWLDLTNPEDARKFDLQTAGMEPKPLSFYSEHLAQRRAERDRRAAERRDAEQD